MLSGFGAALGKATGAEGSFVITNGPAGVAMDRCAGPEGGIAAPPSHRERRRWLRGDPVWAMLDAVRERLKEVYTNGGKQA